MALFVVSCSASPPVKHPTKAARSHDRRHFVLHVDDRFGRYYKDVPEQFGVWEKTTDGIVSFETSKVTWRSGQKMYFSENDEGCTDDVFVISVSGEDLAIKQIEKELTTGNVLGYTQKTCFDKRVYIVADRMDETIAKKVMTHEAGHLIGLDHIPVPYESVMFPSVDMSADGPTELDMKEFCMIYGCDWREMKRRD